MLEQTTYNNQECSRQNNNKRLSMENIYYFPRWNVSIKREVQPSADSIFKQSTPVFPDMNSLNYDYISLYHSLS